MKKVVIMYSKGDGFADLIIRIDGRKFSEDKTAFIAEMPVEDWFKPSNDPYFEWVGFLDEIEKAANTSIPLFLCLLHTNLCTAKSY